MEIKKFILAVFIVISLNFSYQPVSIYAKEKEYIVYTIDYNLDNVTNEFINKNETKKLYILVSLTFRTMISGSVTTFNTS
ncbi:MAG: hypothetical protein IPL53_18955 [Ignavibacteria bacterium]|nr:hypothetical protein [Ignavibacteria bacterium]